MSFDLRSEGWVRVRTEGTVKEISLREAFAAAADIRGLAGEIPSQDAAVLRVLLAILTRAIGPQRTESAAVLEWARYWGDTTLPLALVDDYLDLHGDRFDLLDPVTPFMQVADLTTASGKTSGLGKLIAEVPDGEKFFTTRSGAANQSLSFAEAARWLIHCQAFDPAGIKTGALGDPRVKAGKGYSFGYPAWSGNLGLLIAEGRTLRETLLLNLPLYFENPPD